MAPAAPALRRDSVWLPSGLLAAIVLLTMTAGAFGEQSARKWRSAGVNADRTPQKTASKHAASGPSRGRVSHARWVDPQVRTIAYDQPAARIAQKQDSGGGALFGDELMQEFSKPMGRDPGDQPTKTFEDLPPKAPAEEEPLLSEPPVIEPPLIEPDADTTPAQPGFDPFDERPAPDVDAFDSPAPRRGGGSGARSTPPARARSAEDQRRRDEERSEAAEGCAEELAKLRSSNLTMVDIAIGKLGVEGEDFPFVCSIDDGVPLAPRCWEPITYTWKASALCHKPLYFEQEQLERYGHSWGPVMQPLVSGAHFFGHLAVLPYSMGLKAPNECVYALGHYRPGNCAPYMIPAVPFTWRAAAFQGGFATGAAFLIP